MESKNIRKATFPSTLNKLILQLPYLPRALSLVWTASRRWTIAWGFLLVIQGFLPIATVFLTRSIVDSLVVAVDTEIPASFDTLKNPILLAAMVALVMLLTATLRSIATWVRTAQADLVSQHIHTLIHNQTISLDLSFFEDPESYDMLHRARIDALRKPVALLENMGNLLQNGITLFAMSGVLLIYSPWLPLILLMGTLPALWVVARSTIHYHHWRIKNTVVERRARYLDWMLTNPHPAAEIRIFDLGQTFQNRFQKLREKIRFEHLNLIKNQMWRELMATGLSLSVTGFTLAWAVSRVVVGSFTLGDLALFYQAFNQGQRIMHSLLSNMGDIYHNLLFLENLFEFLDVEPEIADLQKPGALAASIQKSIGLQDICFIYPGGQRPALNNFNLNIPAGQIAAVVGANGAGKSTLIKLLCRLYDPAAGKITFDDVDLRDLPLGNVRRLTTVLFQTPVHYQDSVSNNIAFGDLVANPSLGKIKNAAHAAGADIPIKKLPDDYETVLGRWFGGAELSVGEWQRIALARAFFRKAHLVILDEPTSAMDSWAEADFLNRFRNLVSGQTALIITHRFTTAMQADIIHVIDAGRIIESGTHHELMHLDGHYARSWRQQIRVKNNVLKLKGRQ